MLSVSGIVYLPSDTLINVKPYQDQGIYMSFLAYSKHPTIEKKVAHKINLFVPAKHIDTAKKVIVSNTTIEIRHGDLDTFIPEGPDGQQGQPRAQVKTSWKNIEILTKAPRKEKQ